MWNESHEEKIIEFLKNNERKLLTFLIEASSSSSFDENSSGRLVLQYEIPTSIRDQFTYFVKSYYSQEINTKEAFQKCIK